MSQLLRFVETSRRAIPLLRSRRGSVLILCVVLIVILALIGTAMLSTARIDRFTSTQNRYNTQIDLLIQGAVNVAKGVLVSDLFDSTGTNAVYRRPIDSSDPAAGNYDPWDAYTINLTTAPDPQNDTWLASLVPQMRVDSTVVTSPTPASPAYWDAITAPLIGDRFEDPRNPAVVITDRVHMAITSVPINYPSGTQQFPGLARLSTAGGASTAILAADADGDGIADSLLCRMLPGEIDGVTYYAAYRIVDNSAKVNVNTAWSMASDFNDMGQRVAMFDDTPLGFGPTFAGNLGMFRSHVGLLERLRRGSVGTEAHDDPASVAEMNALMQFRLGFDVDYSMPPGGWYTVPLTPYNDPNIPPNGTANPTARSDFEFTRQGLALEYQLARRLENPGWWVGVGGLGNRQFRAFSLADQMALTHRFVMLNLGASRSSLEEAFFQAHNFDPSGTSGLAYPDSLVRSAPNYVRTTGPQASPIAGQINYQPDQFGLWFDQNFNWDRARGTIPVSGGSLTLDGPASPLPTEYQPYFRPLRPLLTAFNSTSNQIGQRLDTGGAAPPGAAYRPEQPKTNINTADFEELLRAFWCVMREETVSGTPFPDATNPITDGLYTGSKFDIGDPLQTPSNTTEIHPAHMFRSSIRDPELPAGAPQFSHLPYNQMVLLRAAIAANNAVNLRRVVSPSPVTQVITLSGRVRGATDNEPFTVTIYPPRRQPFITEVYAQTQSRFDFAPPPYAPAGPNQRGYVAVELYNPYPDAIPMDGAQIAVILRPSVGSTYPLTIIQVATLPAGVEVPGQGYLLLENYNPNNADSAQYRPQSSGLPPTGDLPNRPADIGTGVEALNVHVVDNLHDVLDGEMVILFDGALPTDNDAWPVDSFDFSGIERPDPNDPNDIYAAVLHYARSTEHPWHWVYPGRYSAENAQRRQQGTQLEVWETAAQIDDPWATPPAGLDVTLGYAANTTPAANANLVATYETTFPIQIELPDTPGPYPVTAGTNQYPFGGFMRDGDILQVPFIAAYRIENASGGLIELNSITMDATMAEDGDANDDPPPVATDDGSTPREQIGRFAPISRRDLGGTAVVDDYGTDVGLYRYAWAKDLFDYLTTHAPSHDYLPDMAYRHYQTASGSPPQPTRNAQLKPATDEPANPLPTDPVAALGSEDAVPIHGRININTAPWPVLATIPWVQPGQNNYSFNQDGTFTSAPNFDADGNPIDDNVDIAKAIVAWRDGWAGSTLGPALLPRGPFESIFDLYKVEDATGPTPQKVFRVIQQDMTGGTTGIGEAGDAEGDFSPLGPLTDLVRHDHEEQYLAMTRVSNLLSTRSDSYTVYLLVQGWRNVGNPAAQPELVVQRRVAFLLDRAPVTPVNSNPITHLMPNE